MSIVDYPILDTSELDHYVSSYYDTQRSLNPLALLDQTEGGFTVEEELFDIIRGTVLRKFAGLAVVASADFALGLDEEDQTEPSAIAIGAECNFTGWVSGMTICDFTDAAKKAEMIAENTEERIILPGLVIKTDPDLDDLSDYLGVLSLMPYCAILPSSAYLLRKITNAAR